MVVSGTVKRIAVLVETALTGLPRMLDESTGTFTFTVRPTGPAGRSLRYTCITLIGLTAAALLRRNPGLRRGIAPA